MHENDGLVSFSGSGSGPSSRTGQEEERKEETSDNQDAGGKLDVVGFDALDGSSNGFDSSQVLSDFCVPGV